ncbi:hypothetical protein [Flavobacterium capsici]|uniref:Uncharacterized protein n=1 Tax=Flavobacterium capsici TaxID=3075618 RepID=A0AA96F3D9_9FLAO|nr:MULTISPECIES: hypothetical protein [unclassified Flavobacterium]WNM19247.1 hypothetical protein RN608_00860 [Flavobacterium sp. PMR2A8]WNM20636.1 hypothetical protein RN605_08030 [Flavobacterium sp. PMTSA4]
MNKADFLKEQNKTIRSRYQQLRKVDKKNRTESLEVISKETDLSTSTIQQILYNPNYRSGKSETVPKAV